MATRKETSTQICRRKSMLSEAREDKLRRLEQKNIRDRNRKSLCESFIKTLENYLNDMPELEDVVTEMSEELNGGIVRDISLWYKRFKALMFEKGKASSLNTLENDEAFSKKIKFLTAFSDSLSRY